ncbi:MAG: hypothetical protein IPL36_00595 [Nigerium sp.]|nr:hypothetical protein [Nigerium sp.]
MTLAVRFAGGLAVTLALTATGLGLPAAAAPDQADRSCPGVWVVVTDHEARCAPEHATGKAALHSAGFAVRDRSPNFLCQIDGAPATCTLRPSAYWSYWQASVNEDGTWGDWVYSQTGYAQSRPRQGDAEGWAFGDGSQAPPTPPTSTASAPALVEPASATPPSQAPAEGASGGAGGVLVTLGVLAAGGGALGVWVLRRRRGA